MKQLLRKIFSPTLLIGLILLIEVSIIFFLEFSLDLIAEVDSPIGHFFGEYKDLITDLWGFVHLFFVIFAIVTFFKILNRKDMAPEFKIPWLVLVFLLPITMTIFYWILSNPRLRKKDKRILAATEANFKVTLNPNEEEREIFKTIDTNYKSCLKYLRNVTKLKCTTGNKLKYYKSGEYFFPDLVEHLKLAKEFIFIEFFIISEGKWWTEVLNVLKEKAKEGVEVRIIYDDFGCYGTLPSHLPRQLAKFGIKAKKFHPFHPILSSYINNRDHRKIVVIDHDYAFTGGNNLADEYANDKVRFGYWKDTMVRIQGPAIANLIAIFLQNYGFTTFKVEDYNKYLVHEYERFDEEGYVFPFGDRPGAYDRELVGENNYLNIINSSMKTLYISTPYLVPTNNLMEALRNASLRGVDVHLILPAIPDKKVVYWMAKCQFHVLLEAGVKIYTYEPGFNHEKQMLADNRIAFIGTINFDYRSLVHHFECGVTMVDTPIMDEMEEDFKEMISVSKLVEPGFKMTRFQRFLCSILKLFATMF